MKSRLWWCVECCWPGAELHVWSEESFSFLTHKINTNSYSSRQPSRLICLNSQQHKSQILFPKNKGALMCLAVLFLTINSSFRSFGLMSCRFLRTEDAFDSLPLTCSFIRWWKLFALCGKNEQTWQKLRDEQQRWNQQPLTLWALPKHLSHLLLQTTPLCCLSAEGHPVVLTSKKGCWGQTQQKCLNPKDFVFKFYTQCNKDFWWKRVSSHYGGDGMS